MTELEKESTETIGEALMIMKLHLQGVPQEKYMREFIEKNDVKEKKS